MPTKNESDKFEQEVRDLCTEDKQEVEVVAPIERGQQKVSNSNVQGSEEEVSKESGDGKELKGEEYEIKKAYREVMENVTSLPKEVEDEMTKVS